MSDHRDTAQRKADVLSTLERHGHAWLATATRSAIPHMVVVAAVWNGEAIVVATRGSSRTARNLDEGRRARLGFGSADDAILIDVEVTSTLSVADAGETGALFRRAAGWDPADEGPDWRYFILRPMRIQAYRGYGEIERSEVMARGRWLA